MQILHPFAGSIQQYAEEISDPDRYRPDHCPQCEAQHPLTAHGFYSRTLVDVEFDGIIRVRRYLCHCCKRTVSLLPEFALPYLRFSIPVISLFLIARLLNGRTLQAAAAAAAQPGMPYQRGQFWVRRFQQQAAGLCAALAALTTPRRGAELRDAGPCTCCRPSAGSPPTASCFPDCAAHLLGWPRFLVPDGRRATLRPGLPGHLSAPHTAFAWSGKRPSAYASGVRRSSHGCQS